MHKQVGHRGNRNAVTVLHEAHSLGEARQTRGQIRKKFQKRGMNGLGVLSVRMAPSVSGTEGRALWGRWQAREATGPDCVLRMESWQGNTAQVEGSEIIGLLGVAWLAWRGWSRGSDRIGGQAEGEAYGRSQTPCGYTKNKE